ncbi:helix-turn-helix domain-containing protein [Aquimarina aquimarini]|uniref:helix-turn-helix domain-containing protein n=1 Tax=Aquimarina aquimarini TaxID=1191734 RepID=UPI000D55B79C|nr:AraC family transcriptional regulator [Aquimarina aquimarini]
MKKIKSPFLVLSNEAQKVNNYSKINISSSLFFSIGIILVIIENVMNIKQGYATTSLLTSSLFFANTTPSSLTKSIYKRPAKRINSSKTSKRTGYDTYTKIKEYIITEKKYLLQDISLSSLSLDFKISNGYISQLINTYSQKKFNDFINELRVEESKKKLLDSGYNNYTIESIGLECGFKSKSNFYTAFKKFTKQTPNQFKSLQNNS